MRVLLCLVALTAILASAQTARCSDILTSTPVFQARSLGVDLSAYTGGELLWMGCAADGCTPSEFYCRDLTDGIQFGTTSSGALRACHGVPDLQNCTQNGCCATEGGLCNAPDTPASAEALCRQLGYDTGKVEAVPSNFCPEVNWDGATWVSDFSHSDGYGKSYTCGSGTFTTSTGQPSETPSRYPSVEEGFREIPAEECPTNPDIVPCTWDIPCGELCEADDVLPDGRLNYNIDNCGAYDVFRRFCPESEPYVVVAALNRAYEGNLRGLSNADQMCAREAAAAGRPETFVAFLAASTRPDLSTLFDPASVVMDLNGNTMYDSYADIFDGDSTWLTNDYLQTFDGTLVDEPHGNWDDADGWTGADASGRVTRNTCRDWTSSWGRGTNTELDQGFQLLKEETKACSDLHAVICVGSGDDSFTGIQVPSQYPSRYPSEDEGNGFFVAIPSEECPANPDIVGCSWEIPCGGLCEADEMLPDGNMDYNAENCGFYDVFRRICSGATSEAPSSYPSEDDTPLPGPFNCAENDLIIVGYFCINDQLNNDFQGMVCANDETKTESYCYFGKVNQLGHGACARCPMENWTDRPTVAKIPTRFPTMENWANMPSKATKEPATTEKPLCGCATEWNPVCVDGIDFSNTCRAVCAGYTDTSKHVSGLCESETTSIASGDPTLAPTNLPTPLPSNLPTVLPTTAPTVMAPSEDDMNFRQFDCAEKDMIVVGYSCINNDFHNDFQGMVCANEETFTESYCYFGMVNQEGHGACARCPMELDLSEPTLAPTNAPTMLTPHPTSVAPSEDCDIQRDVDLPGSDIHIVDNVMSAEDCAMECAQHPPCDSWTWGKKQGKGYSNRCFLKSGTPGPVEKDCCDSGLKNACETSSPTTDAPPNCDEKLLTGYHESCHSVCELACSARWENVDAGCGAACEPSAMCSGCPSPPNRDCGERESSLQCYAGAQGYIRDRYVSHTNCGQLLTAYRYMETESECRAYARENGLDTRPEFVVNWGTNGQGCVRSQEGIVAFNEFATPMQFGPWTSVCVLASYQPEPTDSPCLPRLCGCNPMLTDHITWTDESGCQQCRCDPKEPTTAGPVDCQPRVCGCNPMLTTHETWTDSDGCEQCRCVPHDTTEGPVECQPRVCGCNPMLTTHETWTDSDGCEQCRCVPHDATEGPVECQPRVCGCNPMLTTHETWTDSDGCEQCRCVPKDTVCEPRVCGCNPMVSTHITWTDSDGCEQCRCDPLEPTDTLEPCPMMDCPMENDCPEGQMPASWTDRRTKCPMCGCLAEPENTDSPDDSGEDCPTCPDCTDSTCAPCAECETCDTCEDCSFQMMEANSATSDVSMMTCTQPVNDFLGGRMYSNVNVIAALGLDSGNELWVCDEEWYVKNTATDMWYPTCVYYGNGDVAGACDNTQYVCAGATVIGSRGEMNAALRGQASLDSICYDAGFGTRADFMNKDCPRIKETCSYFGNYFMGVLASAGVDTETACSLCVPEVGGDKVGAVKMVTMDGYKNLCVGYSDESLTECPVSGEDDYVCSGSRSGMQIFGWPTSQAASVRVALDQQDMVHPQCRDYMPMPMP